LLEKLLSVSQTASPVGVVLLYEPAKEVLEKQRNAVNYAVKSSRGLPIPISHTTVRTVRYMAVQQNQ
jgi:hypothetical protein